MGTLRAPWQDKYGISFQTTLISTAKTFLAADVGLGAAGKLMLPLTNHPHFSPGQQTIDVRKAIGIPTRRIGTGYEFQQAHREPSVTYEFHANAYTLAGILWTLFQNGASQSADPFEKTFGVYTSPACEVWASLIRHMSAGTADSHVIHGAIARSITLRGEVGGPLTASVEFIGHTWIDAFDFDAQSSVLSPDTHAPLLWRNAGSTLGIYVGTTPIEIRAFELTITNSAVQKFYTAQTPDKHVLGDLLATGRIYVPWSAATVGANAQLDNFVNGTDTILHVWWGTTYAAYGTDVVDEADMSIWVNMHYTGEPIVGGDVETELDLPFEHAYDGTTDLKIKLADAYDIGIT